MHLYLRYAETVIEISCLSSKELKDVSEQIFNLEKKFQRRINVTVAYTDLEANDTKEYFHNVENAISYLEELILRSDSVKESVLDEIITILKQNQISYRAKDTCIEINECFANLDYFFSVELNEDGESASVYYDCESLGQLGSRDYSSVKDFIKDLTKLKDLDTKFKSLVEYAPFNLDRSKEEEE